MNMCYTVGYGGRTCQGFLDALTPHGVTTIVDVRIRPNKAFMGCFVKAKNPDKGIERLLASEGIDYVWIKKLGNCYMDEENWRDLYKEYVAEHGDDMTKLLLDIPQPFALMCAERKVTNCHREYIAAYLIQRGWRVEHIE